ncbi:MAG: hypothetical protein LBN93_09640 [Candidatus Symbiothrix sp.]|jgi:hypothetical protein|nr:hypothetical protein [Candidatus Symbiothrix sp.]
MHTRSDIGHHHNRQLYHRYAAQVVWYYIHRGLTRHGYKDVSATRLCLD